jgi:hypothetical protein
MPSIVQICNTALSHIGDTANVTSIDPPDGSAQAGYCATFFPLALAALIEMHGWGFATVRSQTAPVDNPTATTWVDSNGVTQTGATWCFAYAYPAGAVQMIAVLPECALDDYSANFTDWHTDWNSPAPDFANPAENMYTPQPYAVEQDGDGNQIILTNVCNAVFRYTIQVSDPTKFSPLFVLALSYLLASMLAGPIIKGEDGAQISSAMMTKALAFKGTAAVSDANQRHIVVHQRVSWMAGR